MNTSQSLGIKAGYNWSYISGSSEGFKKESNNGFMIGAFYAPVSRGLGFRTEIVFSRQGYSFDNGGTKHRCAERLHLSSSADYVHHCKKSAIAGRCTNWLPA